MSVLQYYNNTETPNTPKVWNNAAFDDPSLGSDGSAGMTGWSVLQPISVNRLDSFDYGVKKPTREDIEKEIEKTEREIERLTRRLEELKSKKASSFQKPGRVVPSKFKEVAKFKFETPVSNKSMQRGVSLGPLEILQGSTQSSKKFGSNNPCGIKEEKEKPQSWKQRGVSLGPLEIQQGLTQSSKKFGSSKSHGIKEEKEKSQLWKQRGVSLGPLEIHQGLIQSSKKPPGIKEEKEKSQPWKSSGPKMVSNSRPSRRGVSLGPTEISAIARKTPSKPKNTLEKIEEYSTSNRRLSRGTCKPRIVPSRYSLAPPKIVRDDMNKNGNGKKSPESVTKMAKLLPKIKAVRCTEQSPRDSGRAKRVADLIGRKPFFECEAGDHGVSSFQDLLQD
ncbi:hypothetical protein LUZ62_022766 [Rhynchospora pubera]|uniref:Uncharacterized protein n=1 Tax=Rhynchospora pubera TaxID=906938 RepID=A0AAV8GX16_9POAL|nr:hypothetical protein LUZ62_022766 [Rhynchospora pubera]